MAFSQVTQSVSRGTSFFKLIIFMGWIRKNNVTLIESTSYFRIIEAHSGALVSMGGRRDTP